jgi:hypothetical protein
MKAYHKQQEEIAKVGGRFILYASNWSFIPVLGSSRLRVHTLTSSVKPNPSKRSGLI